MLLAAFALAAALAAEPEPEPAPEPERKTETRKSYLLPAFEIIDFEFLLNRIDYAIYGEDYDVDGESIRRNLRTGFVEEHDPFTINQLGHPYQGSIYHGFARSTGLNFWEALGYTFAGSLLWEIAGETTPPSRNDQIASGIGGSFLGEPLFRMASLLLERGHARRGWLETGAALISPPTGLNRLAGGDRYDAVFDSRGATYYSRFQIGVSGTIQSAPETVSLEETEGLLDFSLEYGLPGARGYAYRRPFDYFAFQGTASTANGIENVLVRGLLAGRDYGGGGSTRGVWGLYAGYDYVAPQTYRVSSTALSLGTTWQWWMSESVALQGTVLAGMGYAAASAVDAVDDHDYHYGIAPQALLATRLIFGDRASLDLTAHEYFVSDVASAPAGGHDDIQRGDVSLAIRVVRKHAVALKYLWNRRDASYASFPGTTQSRGTLGVFYTRIGHDRFGAVDWR